MRENIIKLNDHSQEVINHYSNILPQERTRKSDKVNSYIARFDQVAFHDKLSPSFDSGKYKEFIRI